MDGCGTSSFVEISGQFSVNFQFEIKFIHFFNDLLNDFLGWVS